LAFSKVSKRLSHSFHIGALLRTDENRRMSEKAIERASE
jgi:hypothetical protein